MTGLAPELRDRLTALGRTRTLRRGERLIHEGSTSGAVVLVLDGTLRVTRIAGDEEVVLAIRGPGDLLGELGPITERTAGASVEAREPGRVLVMPASRFVAASEQDAELASALLGRLVELLADSDRRLANAQCRSVLSRVAEEVLLMAHDPSDPTAPDAEVRITQAELASLCVASRSTVAEAVAELRDGGLLETRRGRLRILDPRGLELIVVGD